MKSKSSNILDNVVENYFKENTGKYLSLRKVYRDLKIKRRKAIWLLHQSKNVCLVSPLLVGSNAHFLHVYMYKE